MLVDPRLVFFSILCQLKPRTWYRLLSERLTVPHLGGWTDNRKLDRTTWCQSRVNEKWNSSCCTKTFNTRTDKRNRCRYTGKYQTLTAFRSHVRTASPQSVDYNWMAHAAWAVLSSQLLLFFLILSSYQLVCGENNKDFSLRMSLTTVVLLYNTDWHVFSKYATPGHDQNSNQQVWCL